MATATGIAIVAARTGLIGSGVEGGARARSVARWSEMSRGMGREGDQLNSDEHHLRIFWRKWNQMMEAA